MRRIIRESCILEGKVFVGSRNRSINTGTHIIFDARFDESQPFLCSFPDCTHAVFIRNDLNFLTNNLNNKVFPKQGTKIYLGSPLYFPDQNEYNTKIVSNFPIKDWTIIDSYRHYFSDKKVRTLNRIEFVNEVLKFGPFDKSFNYKKL